MRRMKWGIGAAAVVGLAWLLSNLFNLDVGGTGGDGDSRIGLPTSSEPRDVVPAEPPPQGEPDAETEPVSADAPEDAIGTGGVVEVRVDDRDYLLKRGSGAGAEWVAAEPDAIAAYARQASGDETGVRVRIFRTPSARAAAEERLVEALRGVGLTDGEIDLQRPAEEAR
ncbi:MAG TPA: hypothetical protein VF170_13025 [Planctomycetaceae bacterium]